MGNVYQPRPEILPTHLRPDQDITQWAYEFAVMQKLYMVEHKGVMNMLYKDAPKSIRIWPCGATMLYNKETE